MPIPIITDLAAARAGVLRRTPLDEDTETAQVVAHIIAEVRAGGDDALRALSTRFDGVAPPTLEVPPDHRLFAAPTRHGAARRHDSRRRAPGWG